VAVPTRNKGAVSSVVGLKESINALRKVNPELKREAVDVLRTGAKAIQSSAQSKIGNHPSYRLKTNRGMIGRTATPKGGGVKLRAVKFRWALAAEFGERVAHTPIFRGKGRKGDSRPNSVRNFKRRTAAPFKPPDAGGDLLRNRGGYLIQPSIRKLGPQVTNRMTKDLTKVFVKSMKQSGVKTRG